MEKPKSNPLKSVCLVVLNNFKNDSRVLKEAISLKSNGYQVMVLAMFDNGQLMEEIIKEVRICRIPLKTRSWSKSKPVQLLKYFEFLFKAYLKAKKFDIVHCNDLNALPVGVICKILKNRKVVYDAHEFEINRFPNQSKSSKKVHYWLEKIMIGFADKVITVSQSIADEYSKIYNIPAPELILNCPHFVDVNNKDDKFRNELGISSNSKILLYQGALSKGRGVEFLLDTFSRIKCSNFVLVFMGYGVLEEKIKKEAMISDRIFFKSAVQPDQVLQYTASADFGISFIEDVSLSYRYSLPNKIFEYIMVGIPVIVSDLPEMARIVQQYRVGIVVDTKSENGFFDSLIQEIKSLDMEKLQTNLENARKVFNWENQEKKLISLYSDL